METQNTFEKRINKFQIGFAVIICLCLSFGNLCYSQIIKTVGNSGANYSSLKAAFDAINAGTITGSITLQIINNTTETASAVLNASGSGSASYSSVRIYPTSSGLSITGNIAAPLIDLSGADSVIIDGRVNATGSSKDLTISNANTGTSSSTIRFINSAENNIIRYCIIKGSPTSSSRGIFYFYTSSLGNGNDNNLIDNNNITSDAAGRPINGIYSVGTSGRENSGNIISNNFIYDVWRSSANSSSIQISSYSTNWTISGNSFYETSTIVPTGSYTYNPIKISNTSGNSFLISDNYIGGQSAFCGGSPLNINSATGNSFQGISLNVGTTSPTSVQNNTIKNFNCTSTSTSPWMGIYVIAGAINIGTTTGNTIGASSGIGSISITGNANATNVYAINLGGTGTINCSNNIIGSFTINNSNSAYSSNFIGINRTNTDVSTISNNIIGSLSTSNSIYTTSQSSANAQTVFGIRNTTAGTSIINNNIVANMTNGTTNSTATTYGQICGIFSNYGITTITNNQIYYLTISNANTSSSSSASALGISVATTNTLNTISGNTIYNLSNSFPTFSGNVIGIYFGSSGMYAASSHTVTENFIHSLSVTGGSSTGASIYGIKINTGQTTYGNNIISLGGNTATTIYGIYETGTSTNNNSIYFNAVYISGNLNAGVTNKSYALFSNVTSNVRDFRNNIFMNSRSTTSGSNLHYAAYFNYSVSSSLTLNYNDYYVTGTGGVLGYYAGTNKTSLPIVTGQDANSLAINPAFSNPGGTNPDDYFSSANLPGISGTIITTDFRGITRATIPKMGPFEPDNYVWQGSVSSDFGTAGNWVYGAVPPDGADISFSDSPTNDCYLDQNRTVHNISNSQSIKKLVTNGKQLTITGNLLFTNNAKIDATSGNSVVVFSGTSAQNIPSGTFVSNTVNGLAINNPNGITINNDLTVQQSLTLTNGTFTIGPYTLTLNGPITTTSGLLNGGSSTNIVIAGSGSATIPGVTVNNFVLNRTGSVYLSGSLNILNSLNLVEGTLVVGENTLTLSGNSLLKTNGNIDATNSNSSLIFANSNAIVLPPAIFSGNVHDLTISGSGGLTASGDITVNGVLNLQSNNPSAFKGILDMSSYTLNMGSQSNTIGIGDVTGIVKREHTFNTNTIYTFGSQFTTFTFVDNETKPLWIICKITIGVVPQWQNWTANGKIARYYNVASSENSSTSKAAINMRYLLSELDATYNDETKLVFWHKYKNYNNYEPHEHGKSNQDLLNHTIGVTGIIFGSHVTSNPDESEVAIAYSMITKNTWKGEVAGHETDWNQTQNWTAGRIPLSTDEVLIPGGLNYYPSLTSDVVAGSIEILSGASLSANSYQITISGAGGAWINNGNFNPGTGKVLFNHGIPSEIVTVSGITNFYNIECGENTTMQPVAGCLLRIAGNGTAFPTSVVDFSIIENTVEYNGTNQIIVNPNGMNGNSGYYNLIFSGSGIKSMPVTNMNVRGNLKISGSASVTAASSLSIYNDFIIDEGATFNTGNFNHSIKGDFENNGSFTSASGTTITMNGDSSQWIGGASPVNFYNLTINNLNDVIIYSNVNVNNCLSLSNGNLSVGPRTQQNFKLINNQLPKNNKAKNFNQKTEKDNLLEEVFHLTILGNLLVSNDNKIEAFAQGSEVEFAGSSPQVIPSGAFTNNKIHTLIINNPSGVTMYGDLTIDGSLTLSNGILNTDANTLTFSYLAEDPVETQSSRIVGTARVLNKYVGTDSLSFLSFSVSSGVDDLGAITITRKTGTLGIITVGINSSIQCHWDISSENPPTNGRNVTYKWFSVLDNNKEFSSSNKALNYFSTNNGISWELFGEPIDVSANNPRVISFNTNHFSKWVATDQNSPMPVAISSLSYSTFGRNVKILWTTDYENNNRGFDIERKTLDGLWSKVGFIAGQGNKSTSTNYCFLDEKLNTGKYQYRLKQIDLNGNFKFFALNNIVEVSAPEKFNLSQNYPNPFNPTTKIDFQIPFDSKVTLKVYDISGREVISLLNNEFKKADYYTINVNSNNLASGVYFYRIIADKFIDTKKMVLIK